MRITPISPTHFRFAGASDRGSFAMLLNNSYRLIQSLAKPIIRVAGSISPQHLGKIPLGDAARIAEQACQISYFSTSAGSFGARRIDILQFYCFQLARAVPIYGRRMPSHFLRRIDRAVVLDLQFFVVESDVVATELIGSNVYDGLCIDKNSLVDAIAYFKSFKPRKLAA
jgi:hypothetical protein